ncbi:MAG: hypothetical protein J6Q54_05915, partial [Oscillospiraceae bacterium]|nr:hypothetical protein [Oscillospiraceae bacterium]
WDWEAGNGYDYDAFGAGMINGGTIEGGVYNDSTLEITGGEIDELLIMGGQTTITGGDIAAVTVDAADAVINSDEEIDMTLAVEDAKFLYVDGVYTVHVHEWNDASCTEPTNCECGDTKGEKLPHTNKYTDNNDGTHTLACDVCGTPEIEGEKHYYDNDTDTTCNACGAVREVGPIFDNKLTFNGATLSLDSSLAINWYFASSLVANADDYYVEFEKREGNRQEGVLTFIVGKDQMAPFYDNNNVLTRYEVPFNKVAACEMGNTIYGTIYVQRDGVWYVSKQFDYSVKTYIDSQISKNVNKTGDDAFKTMQLMVECLNYGAAAQIRFGYKTEALVNAAITEEMQTKYGIGKVSYESHATMEGNNATSPVKITGMTLDLASRINMIVPIKTGTLANTDLTAVVRNADNEIVQIIDGAEFAGSNGSYQISITAIDAPQMIDMYSVELYTNYVDENNLGTAVSAKAFFNVETFVATTKNEEDLAVSKAALKYGDAAAKYFGK